MMLLVLPSCHQVKVNGKDVSAGVQEIIETSAGGEGHLVIDVLWKNATGRHHRSIDVATQTDLPAGCTGATRPSLPSPPLSDRYYFLLGSAADPDCNHYRDHPNISPPAECEHNLQAGDESEAKTTPLREYPNVQDQDSGLGFMDSGGQKEEEWGQDGGGEGGGGERHREPGGSSDLRTSDELRFGSTVTSEDEWSSSGTYGIGRGEYERFQKVLERKWRRYSSAGKAEPSLGREALEEETQTENKWEKKVEQRKDQGDGGVRKCKSGEASGQGLDTGHWSPEWTLVVDHQKGLQTCPATITTNERQCRNRSKSGHQDPTLAPLHCDPSLAESSLPGPACSCANNAREGAESEQRQQGSGPGSGRELESDSGQGWLPVPRRARHHRSYMQLVQRLAAVEWSGGETIGPGRGSEATASTSTKRPSRGRLLRERAARIGEQRGGMSTDDDARSQGKMGRHWSRVERRRQWAQARDTRQREEAMVQSRLEVADGRGGRAGPGIVELSRGLASRQRSKKVFDNWVTIQELLAHGSRAADGTMAHSPLLSVTTV